MIKIDDNLLNDVGLTDLPSNDKQPFLAHIRRTLEMRVGTKLASKMSDAQLDEFERFMKGDTEYAKEFLNTHKPGWDVDPKFVEQKQKAVEKNIPEQAIITEYAALRWLEVNYPGYKEVVAEEMSKLKHEVKQNAPQILEASKNPPQPQAQQQPQAPVQPGVVPQPQQPPPIPPQQPPADQTSPASQ